MRDELAVLDASAQAELIRSGELQPLDLVEAVVGRIERLNPRINAVITRLDDKALTQVSSSSTPNGAFNGVPLLLKDYYCYTDGDPYYEGTDFLRKLDWRGTRR
jgi:amidase